jgi:hypothetical protein
MTRFPLTILTKWVESGHGAVAELADAGDLKSSGG